ncbi:hypothetical protein E2C01_093456 [Portunus trituberculatus]|uniref:Uncharacterized protein n=1 Tax=Portunus trituberculatus TaxID=210409 RepID=A0A5B7K0J3_PORTR|nr:hypothetical protein [Portunus trituberculatus]
MNTHVAAMGQTNVGKERVETSNIGMAHRTPTLLHLISPISPPPHAAHTTVRGATYPNTSTGRRHLWVTLEMMTESGTLQCRRPPASPPL